MPLRLRNRIHELNHELNSFRIQILFLTLLIVNATFCWESLRDLGVQLWKLLRTRHSTGRTYYPSPICEEGRYYWESLQSSISNPKEAVEISSSLEVDRPSNFLYRQAIPPTEGTNISTIRHRIRYLPMDFARILRIKSSLKSTIDSFRSFFPTLSSACLFDWSYTI